MTVMVSRKTIFILLLWTALNLISLLNVIHILEPDNFSNDYGFPLPWLVHQFSGLFPENTWTFLWYPIIVDFSIWLVISVATVVVLSKFFQSG